MAFDADQFFKDRRDREIKQIKGRAAHAGNKLRCAHQLEKVGEENTGCETHRSIGPMGDVSVTTQSHLSSRSLLKEIGCNIDWEKVKERKTPTHSDSSHVDLGKTSK